MNYNIGMIYYFLVAMLLVGYFELTGKLFLSFINFNKVKLAFPFGLMLFMAFAYISTSILSYSNCSFWLVFTIYALYFAVSILLLVKYRKKIEWKIPVIDWALVLIFVFVMIYYSYNTALGDSSGFDSTFYLNLISTNIKAKHMNTTDLYYGGYVSGQSKQYVFQSYFYFVSCFTYIAVKLLSYVTIANNYSVIIWIFQILFNFYFASIVINSARYICEDKKYLKYVLLFIFLFFLGKIYWNNVFGFYGNSYRQFAIAYAIMALHELLNNDTKENWMLLAVCLWSACAFSSTGVFTSVFLLFGSFFILVKTHKKIFKWYALILFMPLINLACVAARMPLVLSVVGVLLMCIAMYLLNDNLIKFFNKKYVLLVVLSLSFLTTFLLSYKVTGDVFNFRAFFDNYSERADMTFSYFTFYEFLGKNELIYRLLILSLLAYSLVFEHSNKLIRIFIIIFLVFFSPFNCTILNKLNVVYYRALDIIVNPFNIFLFGSMLFDRLNNKYIYFGSLTILLLISINNTNFKTPLYFHEKFVPSNSYNPIMKMSTDEFDILNKLKNELEYIGDERYIVTTNLYTESVIPNCRYLYGRTLPLNENWSYAEKQVYSMFYPPNYLGERCKEIKADYNNMAKYLKESGIDYLVLDKSLDYYNEDAKEWQYVVYAVSECGYGYSIYSNDSYELFYFD